MTDIILFKILEFEIQNFKHLMLPLLLFIAITIYIIVKYGLEYGESSGVGNKN
jgi:hypothetical protein